AIDHFKHGLDLFAQRGHGAKALQAGNRIVLELGQRGLTKEAEEIKTYLHELLPGPINFAEAPAPIKRPILPTHCPSCGAALRPDEVEWLDEQTAECA